MLAQEGAQPTRCSQRMLTPKAHAFIPLSALLVSKRVLSSTLSLLPGKHLSQDWCDERLVVDMDIRVGDHVG